MRVKAFRAWRPIAGQVDEVASVPYDVVDAAEAAALAAGKANSFLHVVRAEIDLPKDTDPYSLIVYEQAARNLNRLMEEGVLIREAEPSLYLYSQQMGDHIQFGVVASCHIEDYETGKIKIHEKTRSDKEEDRICYVEAQNANTGPVFLAYRDSERINAVVDAITAAEPMYCFVAEDGVIHTVWRCPDPSVLEAAFAAVTTTYVADGHHRAASAVKVGAKRRAANPNHTGEEDYNYFMAVLFPSNQLKVLACNRVVLSLPGTENEFLDALAQRFNVEYNGRSNPRKAGEICMYQGGRWSTLELKQLPGVTDVVATLDVSRLQREVLAPLLGIEEPRTDKNLDFIGGIKGSGELARWVDDGRAAVAFSMYPTSVETLLAVADSGQLMPPKSTWFEPKLRSGLFVNTLD